MKTMNKHTEFDYSVSLLVYCVLNFENLAWKIMNYMAQIKNLLLSKFKDSKKGDVKDQAQQENDIYEVNIKKNNFKMTEECKVQIEIGSFIE